MKVTCASCNKEFDKIPSQIKKSKSGNHFCSKSCSAQINNTYRRQKNNPHEITCINCGSFKKCQHKEQLYCSVSCQHEYKWKMTVELLESGSNLTAKNCKRYHSEVNYSCYVCGISEWQGQQISLELDHIDGDGTHNTIKNTRLLCPNCHSQTDNFKSKNKDNPKGKEYRTKRYQKSLY